MVRLACVLGRLGRLFDQKRISAAVLLAELQEVELAIIAPGGDADVAAAGHEVQDAGVKVEIPVVGMQTHNDITHYVRRAFIMDDCDELMPKWLNMVEGVIGSADVSWNITCDMLQQSKTLPTIKKDLVKKGLEMFTRIAEKHDDHEKLGEGGGCRGRCARLRGGWRR